VRQERWRRFGRVVVALIVGTYIVPSGGFIASALAHQASHLVMEIERQQARAAVFGLTHGPGFRSLAMPGSGAAADPTSPDRRALVHSHGGEEHSHGPAVARELWAADAADPDEHTFVFAALNAHLPTATRGVTIHPNCVRDRVRVTSPEPRATDPGPPPLRPPRA
jgi:hypothetical protein